MKQILKFIACTLLLVMIVCSSCKKETAAPQPPVQTIDTFTTSGKEYIFSDWLWTDHPDTDSDFGFSSNSISIISPQLFFNDKRNIEVSILLGNSTTWIKLPSKIGGADLRYLVSDNTLTIMNRYVMMDNNLYKTKASIKVKFL